MDAIETLDDIFPLSPNNQADLKTHIETCRQCQKKLDKITPKGEATEIANGQEIVLGDRYSVKIEFVDEDEDDVAILDAVEDELSDTALGLKP